MYWAYLKDVNGESMMDKVIEQEHKPWDGALSLIKEAAKIKTENIS